MKDNEIKGKVTIIVESPTDTTKELENKAHKLLNFATQTRLWSDMVESFVVPSDDVPYE